MSKSISILRAVAAVGLLALASCSDMDSQQQKMVTGGAAGAVIGTVGTVMTGGCIPCGTAIGAGVGVAGGYIMDQIDKNTKSGSSSGSSSGGVSNTAPSNSSSSTPYTNN
jgi:osmotically inducible lipoprotein OsmB